MCLESLIICTFFSNLNRKSARTTDNNNLIPNKFEKDDLEGILKEDRITVSANGSLIISDVEQNDGGKFLSRK